MRPRTLLLLLLFTVAVVLSGCGGSGQDLVILAGDYFPTDAGAEWTYRIDVTAWCGDDEAQTTGTIDREVIQVVDPAATDVLQTVTYRDFFHAVPPPAIEVPAGNIIGDYLAYLFDPNGALRNWDEQFALLDTNGDDDADRIQRFAEGPPGGALTAVRANRPFVFMPVVIGAQATNSSPLVTVPFFSNNDTLTGQVSNLGVQYRDAHSFLSEAPMPYAYVSEALEATIQFNGREGSCDGYCKTSLAYELGPVEKDIDLEYRLAGQWLRIHALVRATRYRIIAP